LVSETLTLSAQEVETDAGTFESVMASDGRYTLKKTRGTTVASLQVDARPPKLQITLGKRRFELARTGNGATLREGGQNVLSYRNDVTRLTIQGPKGKVVIRTRVDGSTSIKSGAGTTIIPSALNSSTKRTGPAIRSHPHIGRLVHFDLGGGGLLVDMWSLASFSPGQGPLSLTTLWENAITLSP